MPFCFSAIFVIEKEQFVILFEDMSCPFVKLADRLYTIDHVKSYTFSKLGIVITDLQPRKIERKEKDVIIKILSVFEKALNNATFVETHLVETDDFQFQNHTYNSVSEFQEVFKKVNSDINTIHLFSESPIEHKWIPKDMEKKMEDWIKNNSEYPILSTLILSQKAYVLLGCSVYVMNNQGKTIDHLNNNAFFTPVIVEDVKVEEAPEPEDDAIIVDELFPIMEKIINDEEKSRSVGYWLRGKEQAAEESEELYDKNLCDVDENGEVDIQKFIDRVTSNENDHESTVVNNSISCTPTVPVDTTGIKLGFRG
jgi:hypothetical protein